MNLRELLSSDKQRIFLDGAMGTQLGQMGLEMGGKNNVTNPDAVLAVHERYVGRRRRPAHHQHPDHEPGEPRVAQRRASTCGRSIWPVRVLPKRRRVDGRFVLGDMSSTGKMLKPYGPLSEDDAFATFTEQATILAEGGVDGFIIETMFDLREALCAAAGRQSRSSDLPVIATIAFNTVKNGGRTVMGNTAPTCAQALTEGGRRRGRDQLRQPRSLPGGRVGRRHAGGDLAAASSLSPTPAGPDGRQTDRLRHVTRRLRRRCAQLRRCRRPAARGAAAARRRTHIRAMVELAERRLAGAGGCESILSRRAQQSGGAAGRARRRRRARGPGRAARGDCRRSTFVTPSTTLPM